MKYFTHLQSLTVQQQAMFYNEFNNRQKNFGVAFILCLTLGGLGAHKFYLDQSGKGILYLLLFWTAIPALLAFINLFTMSSQIKKINNEIAMQILSKIS